jgi:malonyl-CoA O-methyltransferase
MRSAEISRAFDRSAATYDDHATAQKRVAKDYANWLVRAVPNPKTVLELGAGTGFATRELLTHWPDACYVATDISPEMLRILNDRTRGRSRFSTMLMDMNEIPLEKNYELIGSSMTFQWAGDLLKTISECFDRAETLAFTLPIEPTFVEWKNVCEQSEIPYRAMDFHTHDELHALCCRVTPNVEIMVKQYSEEYKNIYLFLKSIKRVGAYISLKNQKPISLKTILRKYTGPFTATYGVAFVLMRKRSVL